MTQTTTTQKRIKAALNALGVLTKDTRISAFLLANDPSALHQAQEAILDLQLELKGVEAMPEAFELAAELRAARPALTDQQQADYAYAMAELALQAGLWEETAQWIEKQRFGGHMPYRAQLQAKRWSAMPKPQRIES